jgi:DNA-binding beta-propeller fold protein YncE
MLTSNATHRTGGSALPRVPVGGQLRSDPTDGLIAHWMFDEGTGSLALDSSGNGYDGVVIGATFISPGVADIPGNLSALTFAGPDSVVIPDSAGLNFTGSDPFTISFWAKPDPLGTGHIMIAKTPCQTGLYDYAIKLFFEGTPLFPAGGNEASSGAVLIWGDGGVSQENVGVARDLELGRLTQFAVTYDGAGTVRMYFDGELGGVRSGAFLTPVGAPGVNLTLGNNPCGDGLDAFRGKLDDVRIYNRALSDLEVSALNSSRGLEVYDAAGPYSGTATLKAVLFSGETLVPGKTVTFTLGGSIVGTAVTDASGVATLAGVSLVGLVESAIGATVDPDAQISAGSATGTLTIIPVDPTITWNLPSLQYGATLDSSLFNATASVAGTFSYSDSSLVGTPLGMGQQLCVTFTPADHVHFTEVSQCVTVSGMGVPAEATLAVGAAPIPRVIVGVAVDSAHNLVYADNAADGTIAVIDGATDAIVGSIQLRSGSVSGWASLIAVDSSLNRLYVTDAYQPILWTIDAANRTVLSATQVSYGGLWSGLGFNPTTRLLYLAVSDQNLVAVIDPAQTAQALALIPVSRLGAFSSFAIDPITNLIYIGTADGQHPAPGDASTIDNGNGIDIMGGDPAIASSFNRVTSHLYLPPSQDASGPTLAVNPRTHVVYAASYVNNPGNNPLCVLVDGDPAHSSFGQAVGSIDLLSSASQPFRDAATDGTSYTSSLAVDPVTNTLYVLVELDGNGGFNSYRSEIEAVDGSTNLFLPVTTRDGPPFPVRPGVLAVNPNTGRLYMSGIGLSRAFDSNPSTPDTIVTSVFLARHMAAATSPPASGPTTAEVPQAAITFSSVTTGGTTTVQQIDASQLGLQAAGQFSISDALAYEITTTAAVTSPIQLCFNVSSVNDLVTFGSLAVLHGENGAWIDRTTTRDFATRTMCAAVNSLSPFAIARRTGLRDLMPPLVSCGGPDGGWRATDVAISCTASDAGSGLANADDAGFTLTTSVPAGAETANAVTTSRTVCDAAGNCVLVGPVVGLRVDKRTPSVTIATPTAMTYLLHQPVPASYMCADGGSGVASCQGPVPSGAPVPTTTAGTQTFTVAARDMVGNTASAAVSYRVTYAVSVLYDQTKAVKSGSTIPIKLQLVDATGTNVSGSSIFVTATAISFVGSTATAAADDAGNANPDANFRYDASLGGYVFNLSTKGLAIGAYRMSFTIVGDPTTHVVGFQIGK